MRTSFLATIACALVLATAFGESEALVHVGPGRTNEATETVAEAEPAKFEESFVWPDFCPVTVLGKGAFTPASEVPDGPPELYDDAVWYGTPELYTMINPDGRASENRWLGGEKTFWWSKNFSIASEPEPDIEVRARRLDGETEYEAIQTTHGMRDDIGDFMLVGVTLPEPGCWELTARYRGVALSYVIWVASRG